jgi:hypothetical protein
MGVGGRTSCPIMRLRERRLRCDTVETGGCPDAAAVISADIGLRRSVIGTTTTFRIGDLRGRAICGYCMHFLGSGVGVILALSCYGPTYCISAGSISIDT